MNFSKRSTVALLLAVITASLLVTRQAKAYVETGSNTALLMHFNEGDGQNVYDESANANDGTMGIAAGSGTNDPTWVSQASGCRFGNCIDFAPVDVVRVTSSNSLNITGDLTVEAWIVPQSNTNNRNRTIISKWSSGANARHQYRLRMIDTNGATAGQSNNLEFCVSNGTGTDVCANTATNPGPLTANTLVHVAGTYTASTRLVAIWINGIRVDTATAAVGFTIGTSNTPFLVGSMYTDNANPPVTLENANNSWDGLVDEVRVRNAVPDTTITAASVFNPGPVINAVTHTPTAGNETWTIYNGGGATINLEGWVFEQCSTAANYIVPTAGTHNLAAGATVTISVGAGADTAAIYFTANGTGGTDISTLAASDCLRAFGQNTTRDDTTMIGFVAWGDDAGTGDDDAVTAGLWRDGTYVSTVPSLNQNIIELFSTQVGAETTIGNNEEGVLDWARSPYLTIKGENSPRASGDWYSADAGAGGTRNIPYRYYIEVPSGSPTMRVEIWDADIGIGTNEELANRDRSTGTFDTNTIYTLLNPAGGTVATFTGDATNGMDNTFMTPNGFRVTSPTTGTYTVVVDATQQTGTGADINRFMIRAEGFQVKTRYTQMGSNGPTLPLNYLLYPYVNSGCSFSAYDFDSDGTFTTTQQINFRQVYGATAVNFTIPDASLSGDDVWAANSTGTTTYTNPYIQSDYGAFSLVGLVVGYNNGGPNGNYVPIEMRNYNGGGLADAGDADTDANVIPMYLPTDNGGPPNVPYIIQYLDYVGGASTPALTQTTRVRIYVAILNFTGTDLTSPTVTANIPGGEVLAVGPTATSVTQGSISSQPAAGGSGTITWAPGTLLGTGTGAQMYYEVNLTPTTVGTKNLTGIPGTNGTQATYTSAFASADTVGPICQLSATVGSSLAATAVELADLSATPYNDAVLVEWRTGSELDNLGFNVYRSTQQFGDYVQVNPSLILGLLTSVSGGNYYFVDQSVVPGQTYYYLVEDIDLSGVATKHGPVSAGVNSGLTSFAASGFNPTLYTGGDFWNGETGSGGTSGTPPVPVPPVDIQTDTDDIIITLYPAAPITTPVWVDGESYARVSVDSYTAQSSPCTPQLPVRQVLVHVPQRELNFSIDAIDTATLTLDPAQKVYPQPRYQLDVAATALEPIFCEDSAAYQTNALTPATMLEWLGASMAGDERLATIRVNPVQISSLDGVLTYATRMVVRIHLGAELPALAPSPTPPADNLTAQFAIAANPAALKVRVEHAGLHRLTRDDLSHAGFTVTDPSRLQLYYHGREQAIAVSDSDLIFYAQENSDAQAERFNTYWLVQGSTNGRRMNVVDVAPLGATVENVFWDEQTAGENHIYYSSLPHGEDRDHWFWQYAFAPASPSFPITLSDVAFETGTDAQLNFTLEGVTAYAADPDHHAQVSINGHLAADVTWDGQNPYNGSIAVPLAWLNDGANSITVTLPGALPGVAYDAMYIDQFTMIYPRHYIARSNALTFSTDLYGDHEITGFTDADVVIVDLTTDLEAPSLLTNFAVDPDDAEFTARLRSPDHAFGSDLAAAAISALPPADSLQLAYPSDLHNSTNRGNYVIIAPSEFLTALQPLADYRTAKGLTVKIVAAEAVYDEFGYGIQSPQAIRTFLRYANTHWALKPHYVLLAGDSTYDPKGYLGAITGNHNFIPVPFVETSFMQAGSDSWYALMDDTDLLPDIALGRLPVETTDQVTRYINRVIAYESTPDTATWERTISLVQDDVDAGHEQTDEVFAQTIAAIQAKIPAGYTTQMASENALGGLPQAQQAIIDDINNGSLFINYAGHGSIQLWASEILFQNSSVQNLTNADKLPVIVAMNCLNNYFFFPGFTSLAETMLNSETGGAIGYWSSTGLSTPEIQQLLNVSFYERVFEHPVLGDAVQSAAVALQGNADAGDVLHTFALMGDPALQLKIPVQETPGNPSDPGSPSGGGNGVSAESSQAAAGCQAATHDTSPWNLLILMLPLVAIYVLKRRATH